MRRSERIVRLTRELLNHPGQPLSLTDLADHYSVAKSSLSEDLAIIRMVMEQDGEGLLRTQLGAAGGVVFEPGITRTTAERFVVSLMERFHQGARMLPGGYLYIADVMADPVVVRTAGRMFGEMFREKRPDVVLTVETNGIPLAVLAAQELHVPYVVARRDHTWLEGPSVSTNYESGSDRRLHTMSLARRSIKQGARVVIIDDFMKAGGTIRGMTSLMEEFAADVVGIGVLLSTSEPQDKRVGAYTSLLFLDSVNATDGAIHMRQGNYFSRVEEERHG
ncbi:pur operon repressor [Ferroacidibacillus organovorans]|uniref:Pur operon repressor n=1 Tax=Ferroacidibacillus organovorans TaxID=1765683 RepID=A0A162TYB3_9BACL|nr:pur operon repressor [Ferroacidibacillus organovorans]KYP81238.1 hypothetical protein AYJ22_07925 [Ferroacidibacillus organovorans]OPG16846.1 pur operon repressor [Ferroacidibacillus organovorans]